MVFFAQKSREINLETCPKTFKTDVKTKIKI